MQQRLSWPVLLQIVATLAPSLALLGLGQPRLAALVLSGLVAAFLAWNLLHDRPIGSMALVVGVLPAMMLLRNQMIVFHLVTLFLGVASVAAVLSSRRYMRLLQTTGILYLGYFLVLYWLIAFLLTGDYSRNLRTIEMLLGATAIVLLARERQLLATAMIGVMLTMFGMGAALFPYGTRLGMAYVDGVALGNPISFGLPLTLLLFLLTADGARWIRMEERPIVRITLTGVVAVLLLLSTSRGSWLVAATGITLIFLMNRGHRGASLAVLGMVAIATGIALQTDRGVFLLEAVDRTFSDDRSLRNRTSGRLDQWILFPQVMQEAPVWGFGPGSGAVIYARYSAVNPNVAFNPGAEIAWHSLYQHVAVETGLVGTAVLVVLFGSMLRRNLLALRGGGDVVPLLGTAGFLLIALTVSGMDAASGLFLGFGLLAAAPTPASASPRERHVPLAATERDISLRR